jgi:tRNA dimethylallyltransferase
MTAAPNILALIGPTGSGKTELALQLARRTGAHILSVDSMQVYRDMDIGTAKPTPAERSQTPHHLIDLLAPSQSFTVARYVELADELILASAAAGIPLIATGGTPLYYKSLFEGLFEGPPAHPELRRRLAELGNEALHARLREVDPQAAARIHVNDSKRMIRALEVQELTGRPISAWQTEWAGGPPRHQATWVGLMWDREALNRRINARTKLMLAAGWVRETRLLLERYGELSATAAEATGYRELIEHIHGRMGLDDAVERIKIATRQLARRQMKWFRRFPGVHWLAGDVPVERNVEQVLAIWTGRV